MKSEILRLDWISKSFDHTPLLNYVNLTVYDREIHALMGLNGVGKSTLLQIITGQIQPDGGRIWVQGKPVRFPTIFAANALGIYKLETVPEVVPQLDLAENIALRLHGKRRIFFSSTDAHRYTDQLLKEFSLSDALSASIPGHQMSTLDRQIANVLFAVANQARLLVIDEPFSVLDENENALFKQILLRVRARGIAILFTSHSYRNVLDIADRVSFLRAGCCAATLENPRSAQELLAQAMPIINGERAEEPPAPPAPPRAPDAEEVVLRVEAQHVPRLLSPLRFHVCAGEIVGIVNMGPNRASVCEGLFGLFGRCTGSFQVCGRPVSLSSPAAAISAGIGCVSDSDHYQNLVPQLTYAQNITLPYLRRLFPSRCILPALETRVAEQYQDFLDLQDGRSLSSSAHHLSAGMQKRLALARWFSMPFRVLMLNEPFKNLDPQGRGEVTSILRKKAADGAALVLEFSGFNNLLNLCTRVLVVNNSRVIGMLSAPHITSQQILAMVVTDSNSKPGDDVVV